MRAMIIGALIVWSSVCHANSFNAGDGKWMIVPMPQGIQVFPSPERTPGIWRLNTQTGDMQFCYYSNGGISCSMWVKPPELPLYQNNSFNGEGGPRRVHIAMPS